MASLAEWKRLPSNSYVIAMGPSSQNNIAKEYNFGGITLPNFKTYYRDTIKSVVQL